MDFEYERRKYVIAKGETDYFRWTDLTQYEDDWHPRSVEAVKLAGFGKWYCDIGCGKQRLKTALPEKSIYLPADLKKWTNDTLECDLNRSLLPVAYLRLSDVGFLMGVVEYIYDVGNLFKALSRCTDRIVFSYSCAELTKVDRSAMGWVNTLTTKEIRQMLSNAGFKEEACRPFGETQVLIKARSKRFRFWRLFRPLLRWLHIRKTQ